MLKYADRKIVIGKHVRLPQLRPHDHPQHLSMLATTSNGARYDHF